MKFLVLLLVLLVALAWLGIGRRRPPPPPPAPAPGRPRREGLAQAMLSCAHCGVHLPEADVLRDDAGRPYCSAAHRQAGPRAAG